ncbi:MAG: hypothetical protein LQ343_000750 [Gyalolechia ehrenbergii]|nr:MAG: hypothetical protein LQ343_000750 [Gyalolechia ehrenbergii]
MPTITSSTAPSMASLAAINAEIASLRHLLVLAAVQEAPSPNPHATKAIPIFSTQTNTPVFPTQANTTPLKTDISNRTISPFQAEIIFLLTILSLLIAWYIYIFVPWRRGLLIRRAESRAEGEERVRGWKRNRGSTGGIRGGSMEGIKGIRGGTMGEGIGAPGPEDGYRYGWRYNMRRGQAEMLQRFPSGGSGRERFFEHQTGIQDALSLTFAYLRLFMYEIAKVVEYGCGVYLAYRLVRYFGKQDYERANNSIDQLLGIVIDFTVSVVAALLLPLATILGFRSFVWVGHHDAVEVCDLCGGGPVCQSYIDHTNGINLCAEHRWSEENRLRKANAYEAQEQWVESLNEKKSETENDDVQRASVLPSGRRFSPLSTEGIVPQTQEGDIRVLGIITLGEWSVSDWMTIRLETIKRF